MRFAAFLVIRGRIFMEKDTFIPEKYRNILFLTADDMKEIMRLGENKTYEYLKKAPFKVKETETS